MENGGTHPVANPSVVLVTGDEPLIRMVAAKELCDAGFKVIEAQHAAEAIKILEGNAANVRVLFTDVHMPGAMDGLELAKYVHLHWPWIELLVTSGRDKLQKSDIPDDGRFMPKPYMPQILVEQVRNLAKRKVDGP
jgi:CheY-like chemotaxis protein